MTLGMELIDEYTYLCCPLRRAVERIVEEIAAVVIADAHGMVWREQAIEHLK